MNTFVGVTGRVAVIAGLALVGAPAAAQFEIVNVQRTETQAIIEFRPDPGIRRYELFVYRPGEQPGEGKRVDIDDANGTATANSENDLDPQLEYIARVSRNTDGPDNLGDVTAVIPAANQSNNPGSNIGNSPPFGFPFSGDAASAEDILAQRISAAAEYLTAQGEFLRAEGEALNQRAEARQKVAEAIDMEIDNWKKYVTVYFERREENIRSRMRQRDLYEMRKDQSIRLIDAGVRRRYEMIKNHPRLSSGGNYSSLNFMLDRFHGTPVSYGIPLQEIFDNNPNMATGT